MAERLRELGYAIDVGPAASPTRRAARGRTIGRPQLADALVAAGYAAIVATRSTRCSAKAVPPSCPAAGPRSARLRRSSGRAGGVASLAHPGLMRLDDAIPGFAAAGLPAIEVWHSDHDPAAIARYQRWRSGWGSACSGGSDYHADHSHHAAGLGAVTLPAGGFRGSRGARRSSAGPPCPADALG